MTPPLCHLVHTEWYFIQGRFRYLADRNNLFTFALAEQVKQAPSGTVYGVVENTKHHIIVATPFGKYTIEKKDGGISFMGMSAKVVSAKNGVYKVKTSLGIFTVNARKGTVVKN